MATMNVSLPDPMKARVEAQTQDGHDSNASERKARENVARYRPLASCSSLSTRVWQAARVHVWMSRHFLPASGTRMPELKIVESRLSPVALNDLDAI